MPEELEGLERALADTYFCNFSIFQSLPDSWAIDQLFPIMPIHRLNEEPTRRGVLADITCDSDGKIDHFIDRRDVKDVLELHPVSGDDYYLGIFLVGAYQEILGDLHNLFGDTNTVHVSLGEEGGYHIDHVLAGDTVADVLKYVSYDRDDLVASVRRFVGDRAAQQAHHPRGVAQSAARLRAGPLGLHLPRARVSSKGEARVAARRARAAGLLLHPTSLPGRFPIGDLGPSGVAMLDWMVERRLHGLAGPAARADRAGRLALQLALRLRRQPAADLSRGAGRRRPPRRRSAPTLGGGRCREPGYRSELRDGASVDYAAAERLQGAASSAWPSCASSPASSRRSPRSSSVSPPPSAALPGSTTGRSTSALKRDHAGASWLDWEPALRSREPRRSRRRSAELADEIRFAVFCQFLFFRQWAGRARRRREPRHPDSGRRADLRRARQRRHLGEQRALRTRRRRPAARRRRCSARLLQRRRSALGESSLPLGRAAGATASAGGSRVSARSSRFAHVLRLDHFRGFVAYWKIPERHKTARHGKWVKGPGEAFFQAIRTALGGLPLLAEDLGEIDARVHALRRRLDLPGMRVLQFGFGTVDSDHSPHRHEPRAAVYTGTHDNDTTRGWFAGLGEDERQRVLTYLGATPETITAAMIRAAYGSVAELAILPLQDVLNLDGAARMNRPGQEGGNWCWRVRHQDVPDGAAGPDARARRRHGPAAGDAPESSVEVSLPSSPSACLPSVPVPARVSGPPGRA